MINKNNPYNVDEAYNEHKENSFIAEQLQNFDPELVLARGESIVLVYAGIHRSKNFFDLLTTYAKGNETLILKFKQRLTYIEAPLALIARFAGDNPPLHLRNKTS